MSVSLDLDVVDRTSAPAGALFRRPCPGPERDLIDNFIGAMPLVHAPDSRVTVLRELALESGFPDLVVVVWRSTRTNSWGEARRALSLEDLRLMHYVFQRRRVSSQELGQRHGVRFATDSINRLHLAGLVRPVGKFWHASALDRVFAATKIIAVEAKIGKWSSVLSQARLNTWFASRSYVLVPKATQDQVREARQFGIGVLCAGPNGISEWACSALPLPRSYASWVINDLAWRASLLREGR